MVVETAESFWSDAVATATYTVMVEQGTEQERAEICYGSEQAGCGGPVSYAALEWLCGDASRVQLEPRLRLERRGAGRLALVWDNWRVVDITPQGYEFAEVDEYVWEYRHRWLYPLLKDAARRYWVGCGGKSSCGVRIEVAAWWGARSTLNSEGRPLDPFLPWNTLCNFPLLASALVLTLLRWCRETGVAPEALSGLTLGVHLDGEVDGCPYPNLARRLRRLFRLYRVDEARGRFLLEPPLRITLPTLRWEDEAEVLRYHLHRLAKHCNDALIPGHSRHWRSLIYRELYESNAVVSYNQPLSYAQLREFYLRQRVVHTSLRLEERQDGVLELNHDFGPYKLPLAQVWPDETYVLYGTRLSWGRISHEELLGQGAQRFACAHGAPPLRVFCLPYDGIRVDRSLNALNTPLLLEGLLEDIRRCFYRWALAHAVGDGVWILQVQCGRQPKVRLQDESSPYLEAQLRRCCLRHLTVLQQGDYRFEIELPYDRSVLHHELMCQLWVE